MGDNPIFPFLLSVSAFTAQSKNTNTISSPLLSSVQLCSPLLSSPLLGSTCLHNRDRMQIPIPTELQTATAAMADGRKRLFIPETAHSSSSSPDCRPSPTSLP